MDILKIGTPVIKSVIILKLNIVILNVAIHLKGADGLSNSVDPDEQYKHGLNFSITPICPCLDFEFYWV